MTRSRAAAPECFDLRPYLLDADHATVESSRSRRGGRAERTTETSRFERLADGRWIYGDALR